MNHILYSEWLKLKRSKVVTIGFLSTSIVPLFIMVNSIQRYLKNSNDIIDLFGLYDSGIMFLMLLFAPLVTSVAATYIISREYTEKTLKTIFTVPVSRKSFLLGKYLILFMIVMIFMFFSWLDILILSAICSLFISVNQFTVMSAVFFLIRMLFGGVLLYLTVIPIVYLSIRNKGFVFPFIVTAVICLFNVVLSNSGIAGFFPWTAAYLLMGGHSSYLGYQPYAGIIIMVAMDLIFTTASVRRFLKEDIV